MNKFLRLMLLSLFLLGGQQALRCQTADSRSWDALLDRFERICRMSLDIKASGNQDGADLAPLLAELTVLRDEIKDAGDRMPASAVDRFFVTAGPALRLNKWLSLYGGLGYGSRRLCWEDSEGNWMTVSDASPCGLCAELGASVHLGRIILSAGCLSLPASYYALTFSAGYSFGRFR